MLLRGQAAANICERQGASRRFGGSELKPGAVNPRLAPEQANSDGELRRMLGGVFDAPRTVQIRFCAKTIFTVSAWLKTGRTAEHRQVTRELPT